ncbi:MAG: hypothetical protein ABSC48_20000 [Terracidiphilus sp.]|jgi:hypothetical protein
MKPSSQATIPAVPNDQAETMRFARYGLAIPRAILRALEKRGIYCQSGLSIEHQHLAKRYVLRATESGGAVADMGRYCAYLDVEGTPVPWLQPIDSLSGNGRHAIVIAPELVRIEMLRIGHTYEMAISKHSLVNAGGRVRPVIASTLLFRGNQGTLAVDLWNPENKRLRGSIAPVFYTQAGEVRRHPERFDDAIRKITGALACLGCKHTHVAAAPPAATGGVS